VTTTLVLALSILSMGLLLLTALLAYRLIGVTGIRHVWALFGAAVLLLATRRGILLYRLLIGDRTGHPALRFDAILILVSLLLLAGLLAMRPRVRAARRFAERSQAELRHIISTSPDGYAVVSPDGRLLDANDAYCALTGYTREKLLGMRLDGIDIGDGPGTHRDGASVGPRASPFETCYRRSDGEVWHVEVRSWPVGDPSGNLAMFARDITERRRTELMRAYAEQERIIARLQKTTRALTESEERFRVAIQNTAVMVSSHDLDLRCTWVWNPHPPLRTEGMIGRTLEEILGPEYGAQLSEIGRRVIESGVGEYREVEVADDSARRVFDLTVEPLRGPDGEVVGITTASVELTVHKQVWDALRESGERLRLALANSAITAFTMDTDLRYTWACNAPTFDDSQKLVGRRNAEFLPPDEAADLDRLGREALAAKGPSQRELSVSVAGARHVYDTHVEPICDRDGRVTGLMGVAVDITERKRMEDALRQSEERFRLALRAGQMTVLTTDRDLRCTWVYNAPPPISGEEAIGRTVEELFPSHEAVALARIWRQVLETGVGARAESTITLGTRSRTYDVSVEPLRGTDDALTGLIVAAVDITERKRMEEALRLSEERFRVAIEDSPVTVFTQDANLRYTWVYRAAHYGVGEFIGRTDEEVFGPEEGRRPTAIARRVLKTGVVAHEEMSVTVRGTPRVYDATVEPLRDAEGRILGIVAALIDITERKRIEEALRRSERDLMLWNRIAEVFLTVSDEELYLQVLTVAREATGSRHGTFAYIDEHGAVVVPTLTQDVWDECQVPGKTIVYPPETWGTNMWGRALRERRPLWRNGEFDVPTGHIAVSSYVAVPIVHRDKLVGLLSLGNKPGGYTEDDVRLATGIADRIAPLLDARLERDRRRDERRRAMEALHESEERFRSAFEAAPIGLALMSPERRLLKVNRRLCEILGYTEEELLATDGLSLTHPDDRERDAEYTRLLLGGEIPMYQIEKRYLHKRGHEVWALLSASLARDVEGKPLRFIAQIQDITERREWEEQIQDLNASLHRRVTELRLLNKELESFSYSVSHDLRAPLRGIDGFSQALLEDYGDRLDEPARDYLRRVRAASQRMAQLIDDMLKLSRVTRQEMAVQPVCLSEIVEGIADELRAQQRDRAVEFAIAPGIIANGDRHLLYVALQNLVGNAWKFTRGHSTARIEFGATESHGRRVYFVRDDGAGFEMAYAGKLFGAFQRLHDANEFEGTGIGLAIVQRIIHQHGGEIWAEGEVERGATFYFTLGEQHGDRNG